MGITGFIAFLSTTFICLLYKADISVGMSCLLSPGSHLNLLGLGQRFSSGQKILNSTHVPVSDHQSTSVLPFESKGLISNPPVCEDRAAPIQP